MKDLHAFCIDASFFGCDCLLLLLWAGDIWFEYDTSPQNAAYQWKLKVQIPQEGLGKAAGYNRYLTEPVDV